MNERHVREIPTRGLHGQRQGWAHCDHRQLLKLGEQFSMAAVAFGLIWVFLKLFSRISLLICSDTILKAIKTRNTNLHGNPSTERKTTIFLFLLFYDKYNTYKRGNN